MPEVAGRAPAPGRVGCRDDPKSGPDAFPLAVRVLIGDRSRRGARALVLAALLAGACRHDLGGLAAITPGPGDAAPPSGPRVEGRDCALSLLGIPLGSPDLGAATRAALAQQRGATRLVGVRVASSSWSVVAVGRACLFVSGTPAA